jgi:putative endonuclease
MYEHQSTREKGYLGEDIAIAYLKENGYKILKQNFIFGKLGEIDIIAEKNNILVFVEVKSRTNSSYGDPLESVNFKKQVHLRRTAEGYLHINKIYNRECRMDVIAVDLTREKPVIRHIENAF